MKPFFSLIAVLMVSAFSGCAPMGFDPGKTVTLFDGSNIEQWRPLGDANWRIAEGALQADKGSGFLVTKNSYGDFHLTAEFWSDADANSGIFIRMSDPNRVTADNSYEVNIFDKRPNPTYGTGAIVNVAAVSPMPWAVGKWNTYEITARGPMLTVSLNGVRTVDGVRDTRFPNGPLSLQYAGGVIKFRNVRITPL